MSLTADASAGTLIGSIIFQLSPDFSSLIVLPFSEICNCWIALFGVVIPALEPVFPSPILARVLRESGCAQPVAAAVGYQEPSLVFLAGTPTRLTDGADAADFLAGGQCRFALVEQRQERSFAEHADAIGLRYAPGPRIDGINISNGQNITVAVFRSEDLL